MVLDFIYSIAGTFILVLIQHSSSSDVKTPRVLSETGLRDQIFYYGVKRHRSPLVYTAVVAVFDGAFAHQKD